MGEFGAVSVVSGHIRGATNTIPLHVEILYNEYNSAAAFAMASLLTILTLVTIALKALIDRKSQIERRRGRLRKNWYEYRDSQHQQELRRLQNTQRFIKAARFFW